MYQKENAQQKSLERQAFCHGLFVSLLLHTSVVQKEEKIEGGINPPCLSLGQNVWPAFRIGILLAFRVFLYL